MAADRAAAEQGIVRGVEFRDLISRLQEQAGRGKVPEGGAEARLVATELADAMRACCGAWSAIPCANAGPSAAAERCMRVELQRKCNQ